MPTTAATATVVGALDGTIQPTKQPAPPCIACGLYTDLMFTMQPGANCKAHRLCSRCWKDPSK